MAVGCSPRWRRKAGRPAADLALERELALRDLQVEGILRPVELLRTAVGHCLLFDDAGLTPLSRRLESGKSAAGVHPWRMSRTAAVLSALHRHDVLHGNINTSSIWTNDDGTGVQITGFAYASQGPGTPPFLGPAGRNLTYLSPEQTGRMNRAPDHRSDLYSLGIVAYEMLAGRPPFHGGDPLELIHAHIARAPAPLDGDGFRVPAQVSRIVMRLLAKAADDRYRTAAGVAHDLQRCATELRTTGTVGFFGAGARDQSDRFVIPQRLYGRDREIATLTDAFTRTCEGRTGLLLVSGYSGVGKTSLIEELQALAAQRRAEFARGKFDQIVRNIPYGALVQAFRALVRQRLADSEARLAAVRDKLLTSLGPVAGVLTEVIPELELILGRQDLPPPLAATESQNRF